MMKKTIFLLGTLLACAVFSPLAQAASIVNLDREAHMINIDLLGRKSRIRLEPDQRWESELYPLRVHIDEGQSQTLEQKAHYAIWKNGVLAVQRRSSGYGARY